MLQQDHLGGYPHTFGMQRSPLHRESRAVFQCISNHDNSISYCTIFASLLLHTAQECIECIVAFTAKGDAVAGVAQVEDVVLLKEVCIVRGDILGSEHIEQVGCLQLSSALVVAEHALTTVSC